MFELAIRPLSLLGLVLGPSPDMLPFCNVLRKILALRNLLAGADLIWRNVVT